MPKKKPVFGKPVSKMPNYLPNHLPREKTVSSVLQSATRDDYVSLDVDGKLDSDALMKKYVSPSSLLRSVLMAIVEAPARCQATNAQQAVYPRYDRYLGT